MPNEAIHHWLGASVKRQFRLNALTSLATFALAALILAATYYIVFFVCAFFLFDLKWMFGSWQGVAIPLAVIMLLFWTEARTPQEHFGNIEVKPVGPNRLIVIPGGGANINPIAPSTINSAAKMISDCLCAGPRAFYGAIGMARRASRLKGLNLDQSAAVLSLLYQAGGKTTYQEIADGVEGVDLATTIPPMRDIDGIVFLHTEPAGMSTTQELREELLNALRAG